MLQIIVDESFYSVWALNTAVAQNRLIENLQSAFPQMLVENPTRVKQCVRIALQVQLNHYKQLEASEGVFIQNQDGTPTGMMSWYTMWARSGMQSIQKPWAWRIR